MASIHDEMASKLGPQYNDISGFHQNISDVQSHINQEIEKANKFLKNASEELSLIDLHREKVIETMSIIESKLDDLTRAERIVSGADKPKISKESMASSRPGMDANVVARSYGT